MIKTKSFLILIVLGFLTVHYAMAQEVKWYTFSEAMELNKKEPRKIIIDVYTDWCGWCKVMDRETFHHPVIAKILNEKYYPVKFNAERTDTVIFQGHTFINEGNGSRSVHQLAAALLNGKMSYPSIVFMDEKNQLITAIAGYQQPKQIEPILMYIYGSMYEKGVKYPDFVNSFKSEIKDEPAQSDNQK